MSLSRDLISQFIKATNDETKLPKESTAYGTVRNEGGKLWIQLDGSDILTPLPESAHKTTNVSNGERVIVTIKNHQMVVTGNLDSPSARLFAGTNSDGNSTTFLENIDIGAAIAKIDTIESDYVKTDVLDTELANVETLIAEKATIGALDATNLRVSTLEGEVANLNNIVTGEVDASLVTTDKLEAVRADIMEIRASDLRAINGEIDVIKSDYATIELLESDYVKTDTLEANYVKAESIEGKYANIDFSNITKATMEDFYSKSGLIAFATMENGVITRELVGVTIKGDLIEGSTVKADKLVIKGSDGLYYKLNMEAGKMPTGETVPEDSIHGSVITTDSITADKVSVTELAAFGATIGGFKITDNSLYSGVKETVDNTTRGIYFDSTGQIAIGDAGNYLKYFKDTDGRYKLDISAQSVSIKSGDTTTNIGDAFDEVKAATVVDTTVMYALSDSLTTEPTSGWSAVAPEWTTGKYMWQKTVTTYGNGTTKESDPTCISGAAGQNGEDATVLRIDSSRGTVFKNNTVETVLSVVVYRGAYRITDISTLKSIYGSGAYLQWSWQRMNENRFGNILSTDPRIGNDGFTFTLSAEDVDTKVVFMCSLII